MQYYSNYMWRWNSSYWQVPDYLDIVKQPMDFSTMRKKVDDHQYRSFDEFSDDFDLIIRNCMDYNEDDTMYYKAAVRLRDQVSRKLWQSLSKKNRKGMCVCVCVCVWQVSWYSHTGLPIFKQNSDFTNYMFDVSFGKF